VEKLLQLTEANRVIKKTDEVRKSSEGEAFLIMFFIEFIRLGGVGGIWVELENLNIQWSGKRKSNFQWKVEGLPTENRTSSGRLKVWQQKIELPVEG
jgi:hypothetical protein